MPLKVVYSKEYRVDIGAHVFPTSKYDRIKERLCRDGVFKDVELVTPQKARDEEILLAHTAGYLKKLKEGTLSDDEIRMMELPYSEEIVRASLICCGGTILAARISLEDGIGIHLGGGFHHAFADHGEGFCVLNDIAVAICVLKKEARICRPLVVDCDLHQGNGTAAIFAKDPDTFTFSIHQEDNYPFFKPKSSLDIGLRDGAGDREYLSSLSGAIPRIISDFRPDFLMYVAGADPYRDDRLGGLALSKEGLRARDELVFGFAKDAGLPVAVVLAGGYASREEDTVDIHCNMIAAAIRMRRKGQGADRVRGGGGRARP